MDKSRRRWIRFSIGTLLFLMLCVGGFLGGYRSGYDVGLNAGEDAKIYAVSYQVGDLVVPLDAPGETKTIGEPQLVEADFDSLHELITTTVDPETWTQVGGPASIRTIESNLSFAIAQTRGSHERIATLLAGLRKNNRNYRRTIEARHEALPSGISPTPLPRGEASRRQTPPAAPLEPIQILNRRIGTPSAR